MGLPRSLVAFAVSALVALTVPVALAQPAAARPVGGDPLTDVIDAANANVRPDCALNGSYLAALMLAVTYPEAGSSATAPPSPMTLSRWDLNNGLFAFSDPNTPYRRAYFNPGVGMWQFDSAGLGRPHAAPFYMDTRTAAPTVARYMATRWCTARANPQLWNDQLRRTYVWSAWNACDQPVCESIFNEILDPTTGHLRNLTPVAGVTSTGGMQLRRCREATTGIVVDCWYVDPARAQGFGAGGVGWANPNTGAAPLSLPFYVYELNGQERRHWLTVDTGYGVDIAAARPLTANARGNLQWTANGGVCDVTLNRGACQVTPPLGPPVAAYSTHPAMAGAGRGPGAGTWGSAVAVAERRSDGTTRLGALTGSQWSGWHHLGGRSTSDPDVASFGATHQQVFIRGTDGAFWHGTLDGGTFGGWSSLGGFFTSAPTAVSWSPGRIDVFGRGGDGALWTGVIAHGTFSGWSSLGGGLISDPTVTSWAANRLDVFATGTDGALWHRAYSGTQWLPWEWLGGNLTAAPGAASPSADRIDIAARGGDGGVYVMRWNGSSWTPWQSIGGNVVSAPDVVGLGGESVMVVARGADDGLYRIQRTGASWALWTPVP